MRLCIRTLLMFVMVLPALALVVACGGSGDTHDTGDTGENPILDEWDTPFGVPPFDQISEAHYLPAFREGMTEQAAEVQAIIDNPEEPTFANTIEQLERSGAKLTKASNAFFPVRSALNFFSANLY